MKIIIDGRMYRESGIGRYIRNLITNLQILDRKDEYFILHKKPEYDTLVYHTNFHKVLADFKWYGISEQIKLPRILNRLKPDLVHIPHFNVPFFYGGKFAVTIHDLIHQHFQMRRASTLNPLLYKLKNFGYRKVFNNAIKKSIKILVPSNYVKKLLIDEWQISPNKIVITQEAVDDKLVAIASSLAKDKSVGILKKLNISKPYIFYVGNAHPHKNLEGLIKAYLILRKRDSSLSLVLSGYDHYFWQKLKRSFQFPGIIYPGYIDDESLVALYKNATCFVMPSFEEGFGIPILEAMAAGCPVVSSTGGALPEVGGNSAIYFDPHDTKDMSSKIDQVLNSHKLRLQLVAKGKKKAKLFSWKKLAKQTLEIYEQCV